MVEIDDRTRNLKGEVRTPEGVFRVPFPCDECHMVPAAYGCIESPGAWLRCAACWLENTWSEH